MGVCVLPIPQLQVGCGVVGIVTHDVYSGVLGSIAKAAADAETEVLKLLTTAFLNVPTPNLAGGAVTFLQGSLTWLVVAVATVSLIVAAGRLVWQRKADPAVDAMAGIFRLILVTGAGAAVVGLLLSAGDSFSTWIVDQSVKNPAGALNTLGNLTGTAFSSPFLVLVIAALAVLGFLVQIILLLVRSALLVVLVATWPLAAAASMTSTGAGWEKKTRYWILAAVLYKPAAGICFAAALHLLVTSHADGIGQLEGITLILLASVALPALLKLIVPLAAAAGGVSAGAAIGAAAGLATGAVMLGAGGAAMAGRTGAAPVGLISKGSSSGGSPTGSALAGDKPAATPRATGAKAGSAQSAFTTAQQSAKKLTDGAIEGESAS